MVCCLWAIPAAPHSVRSRLSVLAVDQEKGHFIYLGDRWDSGKADSTYALAAADHR